MGELLLYALDEAGETAFAEQLPAAERGNARGLAEARLRDHHAVEVWDGPLCILRLRRRPAATA
ncbi:hypothetical protein [Phenylobacterium sp.]|uniref:hypothetical protein n=1 Tax=Phenylobacterium sp. TaxID=1871053 RepID=UPI002FE01732